MSCQHTSESNFFYFFYIRRDRPTDKQTNRQTYPLYIAKNRLTKFSDYYQRNPDTLSYQNRSQDQLCNTEEAAVDDEAARVVKVFLALALHRLIKRKITDAFKTPTPPHYRPHKHSPHSLRVSTIVLCPVNSTFSFVWKEEKK